MSIKFGKTNSVSKTNKAQLYAPSLTIYNTLAYVEAIRPSALAKIKIGAAYYDINPEVWPALTYHFFIDNIQVQESSEPRLKLTAADDGKTITCKMASEGFKTSDFSLPVIYIRPTLETPTIAYDWSTSTVTAVMTTPEVIYNWTVDGVAQTIHTNSLNLSEYLDGRYTVAVYCTKQYFKDSQTTTKQVQVRTGITFSYTGEFDPLEVKTIGSQQYGIIKLKTTGKLSFTTSQIGDVCLVGGGGGGSKGIPWGNGGRGGFGGQVKTFKNVQLKEHDVTIGLGGDGAVIDPANTYTELWHKAIIYATSFTQENVSASVRSSFPDEATWPRVVAALQLDYGKYPNHYRDDPRLFRYENGSWVDKGSAWSCTLRDYQTTLAGKNGTSTVFEHIGTAIGGASETNVGTIAYGTAPGGGGNDEGIWSGDGESKYIFGDTSIIENPIAAGGGGGGYRELYQDSTGGTQTIIMRRGQSGGSNGSDSPAPTISDRTSGGGAGGTLGGGNGSSATDYTIGYAATSAGSGGGGGGSYYKDNYNRRLSVVIWYGDGYYQDYIYREDEGKYYGISGKGGDGAVYIRIPFSTQ